MHNKQTFFISQSYPFMIYVKYKYETFLLGKILCKTE